jgi:hypothetical protein
MLYLSIAFFFGFFTSSFQIFLSLHALGRIDRDNYGTTFNNLEIAGTRKSFKKHRDYLSYTHE